ncbi:hypothetical protein BHM03_00059953, partial [Ensete ventricosum]
SVVQPLVSPVCPAGYLCWVGHVSEPVVRGCDDLTVRLTFVISGSVRRTDHRVARYHRCQFSLLPQYQPCVPPSQKMPGLSGDDFLKAHDHIRLYW